MEAALSDTPKLLGDLSHVAHLTGAEAAVPVAVAGEHNKTLTLPMTQRHRRLTQEAGQVGHGEGKGEVLCVGGGLHISSSSSGLALRGLPSLMVGFGAVM